MQLIGVDKLTEIKQESNEIYHGSLRKPAHRREVGGSWPVTHKVDSVCYSVPWLVRYRARLSDKDLCLSRFRSIPRHRISRGVNCPLLPCVYTPINARVQFSEKRAGKLLLPVEVFVLLASLFLKVCNCEISNFVASLFCVRVSWCLRRNSLGVYIVLIVRESLTCLYVYKVREQYGAAHGSPVFRSAYIYMYSRESVGFMWHFIYTWSNILAYCKNEYKLFPVLWELQVLSFSLLSVRFDYSIPDSICRSIFLYTLTVSLRAPPRK